MGMLPAALLLLSAGLAAGQEQDPRFEATPLIGYRIGGSFQAEDSDVDLDLDEAPAYAVLLGFPLDDQSIVEIELSHMRTTLEDGGLFQGRPLFDLDVDSVLAGGRYQFEPRGRARGFVAGGLGLVRYAPRSPGLSNEWAVSLGVGGGALIHLGGPVSLRLEGRGVLTWITDSSRVFCDNAGCVVYIEGQGLLQGELRAGLTFAF
jgi:hypothetical protein